MNALSRSDVQTFGEADSSDDVYRYTVMPLVAYAFQNGRGTCFAYGQTGSGKTFTMTAIQENVARDLFSLLASPEHRHKPLGVYVSFFEIYGGRCCDLLHDRNLVNILEDGDGRVQTVGLIENECKSEEEMLEAIRFGNACVKPKRKKKAMRMTMTRYQRRSGLGMDGTLRASVTVRSQSADDSLDGCE